MSTLTYFNFCISTSILKLEMAILWKCYGSPLVIDFNRTLVCKWRMVRCGSKNKHQNDMSQLKNYAKMNLNRNWLWFF